jgi:hypothetical protein
MYLLDTNICIYIINKNPLNVLKKTVRKYLVLSVDIFFRVTVKWISTGLDGDTGSLILTFNRNEQK